MSVVRGEIIRVNLNPTQGREQQGKARPCLVVSNTKFNQRRKMAIVLPITNTIKPSIKTLVPLPNNLSITGSVDTEQVRNIDLENRWWKTSSIVLQPEFCDRMVAMLTIIIKR
ncbi:MAG: type II toxin-antitoxin system PemK/MazF family toxin [Waterburya sp.]